MLWLGGGAAGTTYTVTLTVGTQAGRVLSRAVLLPVRALGAPAASGVLQTETGAAVQDSAGNALAIKGS